MKTPNTLTFKKNYNWYYYLAFLDGLIGIAINGLILISYYLGVLIGCLLMPITLGIIVASIAVIIHVLRNKKPKIHLILPVGYLVLFALSFCSGFVLSMISIKNDIPYAELSSWLKIVALVASMLELLFSAYMLLRNLNVRIKWPTK